jgi:hypothetical protein
MDFERKFEFYKIWKNIYMRPLRITGPKYGCHDQEILNFSQFLPQTDDFR